MSEAQPPAEKTKSRFSLDGLSAAFARLTGTHATADPSTEVADALQEMQAPHGANEMLSPQMIVEGMLFVGNREGEPLSSRELAANIRNVSPSEVDDIVTALNLLYQQTDAPYEIASVGAGYRMQLRPGHEALRQRFYGRVREAKLTPHAIEVLSIVAYRQPVTSEEVARLRGSRSNSILNQLVRRGLLSLERTDDPCKKPQYFTTERFNQLFRIDSPQDLPRSEDLDDN